MHTWRGGLELGDLGGARARELVGGGAARGLVVPHTCVTVAL